KEGLVRPRRIRHNRPVPDPASESKTAADLTGWQRLAVWLLGLLLKLWARTIRIDITSADRARLDRRDRPIALVIWHNRLFMAAEVIRTLRGGKSFHGLV